MYGDLKGSFPRKYRKLGVSLKCELCEANSSTNSNLNVTSEMNMETPRHFLELCPLVSDLRTLYDTDTDLGLIEFFKSVMERRAEVTGSQASYDFE